MYAVGRGVPLDYAQAYIWHSLAALDAEGAEQEVFRINRDQLEDRLTAQQFEEALLEIRERGSRRP